MSDGDRQGPLGGVRVLDLSTGQGRYGAKLLAELGADVVRLAAGEAGPTLQPNSSEGVLSWWYDANCHLVPLEVGDDVGAEEIRRLVGRADVFLEDAAPGALDRHGLGPDTLAALNPRLVHVSLSPFGATGPRAGWCSSDLVAQALAGHLSVTGDVDRPIALWGRQSAVVGGLYAATSALAGLRRARATGEGAWIDLSLHEALISCTEHLLMYWWFAEALAPLGAPIAGRQRSLHWIRAFEVVPCKRGACMVSPAAGGLLGLIAWLKARGYASDVPDEPDDEELLALIPAMMEALKAAALDHDASELFLAGQSLHVPFGESYTVDQVAACPQHLDRGFFRPAGPGDDIVRIPGPLARFAASPAPEPTAPEPGSVEEIITSWSPAATDRSEAAIPTPQPPAARPLEGIRVLDFTHVLAGPFATRVLADLGADVIRIQTDERSAGAGDNAFPYNVMWARTKRSVQLAMKHDRAREVLRPLVEQADVVIDNYSAGVMSSWGAGPDQLAEWNPKIISLSMSGCGDDGPWRQFVTYAPTVHALGGLTALSGPPGETDCGPGVAYNDHVSGLTGAVALLAALEHRAATGRGQHLDISQLEVGTHLIGPAIVEHLATGRTPASIGNRDPFADHLVNGVFPCRDDRWLAVTIVDEDGWDRVASALDLPVASTQAAEALATLAVDADAPALAERLQAASVAAGIVATAADLTGTDPQLDHRDWLVTLDSDLIGSQTTERHPGRWYRLDGSAEIELAYGPSPFLGQHNFEVYPELLGWDEVAVAEAIGDELFL